MLPVLTVLCATVTDFMCSISASSARASFVSSCALHFLDVLPGISLSVGIGNFVLGDDVRLLIRKGAFERGTWEYTKDVFRIYDVQQPDKKSTSRVAKYFVMGLDF